MNTAKLKGSNVHPQAKYNLGKNITALADNIGSRNTNV
jgi:hypothetical protein